MNVFTFRQDPFLSKRQTQTVLLQTMKEMKSLSVGLSLAKVELLFRYFCHHLKMENRTYLASTIQTVQVALQKSTLTNQFILHWGWVGVGVYYVCMCICTYMHECVHVCVCVCVWVCWCMCVHACEQRLMEFQMNIVSCMISFHITPVRNVWRKKERTGLNVDIAIHK